MSDDRQTIEDYAQALNGASPRPRTRRGAGPK